MILLLRHPSRVFRLACALALCSAAAVAQDGSEVREGYLPVDPRSFGLEIQPGEIVRGGGEKVTTHDEDGRAVVARLHVRCGDSCIVMLPDGQLVARKASEAPVTDRRFEPLERDELAARLATGPLSGFQTRKTRNYVYVYNTSENFALVTSRILESMIPGMLAHARSQRIAAEAPEVPLVAIMFRTQEQFQSYRRMPPGVLAYYHTLSNQIVMYEDASLGQIKPELAIQQAISTIAHEGAHQILHNIGVQQRLSVWPMWISEGLAEYYAPTTFGRQMKWKGAGEVNDLRMFELELYLKSRDAGQANGELVRDTVQAAGLTSTGYATAWSLTHYLARREREDFNAYVRACSSIGPLQTAGDIQPPGLVPANLTLFQQHFGNDLEHLEKQLVSHLQSLPYNDPFAEWPHFVALIVVPGRRTAERDANLFHTRELAMKWIAERLQSVDEGQRALANSQIRTFPNRTAAEQYARRWLGGGR